MPYTLSPASSSEGVKSCTQVLASSSGPYFPISASSSKSHIVEKTQCGLPKDCQITLSHFDIGWAFQVTVDERKLLQYHVAAFPEYLSRQRTEGHLGGNVQISSAIEL